MATSLDAPDWLATDPLPARAKGWKPRADGRVKLVTAWGPPPEQFGAGQDDGDYGHGFVDRSLPSPPVRDDWTHDPTINRQVTGIDSPPVAPYDGSAAPTSGDSAAISSAPADEMFRAPASTAPTRVSSTAGRSGGGSVSPPPSPSTAPSPDQQSFLNDLLPSILPVADETGIPWQVLAAIPANETGWGKYAQGNNYYGIKGTGPLAFKAHTWEVEHGQRVNNDASFQGYSSPADSARGFAQFLNQNPRYKDALDYLNQSPGDWQGFATRLQQAGYATDPQWASKIIDIGRRLDSPVDPQTQQPVMPPTGSSILNTGLSAVGSKYMWGGPGGRTNFDPQFVGSDCSGFVSWVYYNSTGVKLPAQTSSIYQVTKPISQADAMPGDIIEFDHGTGPHNEHVAIYAGNGMMLHDSSLNPDGGVELTPIWTDAKAEFRRVPGVDPQQFMNVPGVDAGAGLPQGQHGGDHMFDPEGNLWVINPDGTATMGQPLTQGAGSDVGAGADDGETIDKRQARYTPKAKQSFCRDCTMFVKPKSCTLVEGKISPKGTCDYHEPKNGKVGAGQDENLYDAGTSDTASLSPEPQPQDSFLDEIGRAKDAVASQVQSAASGISGAAQQLVSGAQEGLSRPTQAPVTPQSVPGGGFSSPGPTAPQGPLGPDAQSAPSLAEDLPDITPSLQADPQSPLGQVAQAGSRGQAAPAATQLAAVPQLVSQQTEATTQAATNLNPLRDVPVLGGAIEGLAAPESWIPADRALALGGRALKAALPAADSALTRAAYAVSRSRIGGAPGVRQAAEAVGMQPAQASAQFATTVAGGVAGGKATAMQLDPNDPNYWPKVISGGVAGAAATHTGVHFLLDSGILPKVVDSWNRIFTPVDLLTDEEKQAVVGLANKENSAKAQGWLWKDRIKATLGKQDNLNWAKGHEEFGANNPLISNPHQSQLAADMIDFTNRTGNIGRQEGFITGDVAGGPHVPGSPAPAVHFPHVYDQGLKTAKEVARSRGGFNPMDTYSFQRTHALLSDAQAAGLTPVNSVSDPYSMYVRRVLSSQGKAEFAAALKKIGNTKNIVHVSAPGAVPDALAAAGWTSGKQFSTRFQNMAMSPDMARVLNNLYTPSRLSNFPVLGGGVKGIQEIKQILLGASGFHGGNLIRQFLASNGQTGGDSALLGIMFQGATPGGFRNWALTNADAITEAADWGVTLMQRTQAEGGIAKSGVGMGVRGAAGGGFGFAAGYKGAKDQGQDDQAAFEAGLKEGALGAVGAASTRIISDAVFQRYLPMMKVTTFQLMKDAAGPEAAAQFVNDAFGGQNIAAMGRSRTVQDALRVVALAPDWQEGWIKQIGNALKPGTLGDLNRQYWANALVQHAVFLEGMNVTLNGHMSQDNGTGHEFDLELTGLYDRAGWPHTDPNTGQPYRVYASVLGPYKGMLTPVTEAGQALAGVSGHTAGTFGKSVADMASSRVGIAGQAIGAVTADTDWKGAPVVPRGTDPWKAAALRVGQALANLAPIGVQTLTSSEKLGPAGETLATIGIRATTMTPLQQEFKDRQAVIDQAGRTPAELFTINDTYSRQLADNNAAAQAVYDGNWTAPGGKAPTHGQMDAQLTTIGKERPKYAEHINSYLPDNAFGGDASKQRQFVDLIQKMHPGISGAQVPADLPDAASPDEAYTVYWGVPQDKLQGLSPAQQNAARGKALVQWALSNNVDYQAALDAVKAKAWGGGIPPKLPDNVTSEAVDGWVAQWGDAPDADAKRKVIDDLARQYMPGDPNAPDTVWQRIKLRMMPAQQPTEVQVSRDKALDILFASRDPNRFPKYQGPDGQAMGGPDQWASFDQQIANGTRGGKPSTPEVKALMDARDRASSAQKNYILNHVNDEDYQRWFGVGKAMTEQQWQTYQKTGYPHYNDNGSLSKDKTGLVTSPQENLNRDRIEQQWQAATPAARNTTKVQMTVRGKLVNVTLQQAHGEILHTIEKGWAKALDIPGSSGVSSEGP